MERTHFARFSTRMLGTAVFEGGEQPQPQSESVRPQSEAPQLWEARLRPSLPQSVNAQSAVNEASRCLSAQTPLWPHRGRHPTFFCATEHFSAPSKHLLPPQPTTGN